MNYLTGKPLVEAEALMGQAAALARSSNCFRSRCGSVLVAEGGIIGRGWNSPPKNACLESCLKDALPKPFKSDATCCVHAEQRAIHDALRSHPEKVLGSTLYFIRLNEEGEQEPADEPYCTICSKVALDEGVGLFVLKHPEGIAAYDTHEYNEISFGRLPSARSV